MKQHLEPVTLPSSAISIPCKMMFKRKLDEQVYVALYKARLVSNRFVQKCGVDYDLLFAQVVWLMLYY